MCHKCAHFECALSGGGPVVRQVFLGNHYVHRPGRRCNAMRCDALRCDAIGRVCAKPSLSSVLGGVCAPGLLSWCA